ncbi:MAG: DUF5058 family protein [Clostridiales bacterium]|nr:DUF5058 family protein [Clostridiales bacterium]
MTFTSIMNSIPLYALVIAGLLFVFALCVVTLRQARQRALELGLSKEDIMGVIRSSALFSIVPSLSIVVGLFSLQAMLGVPWSWFRLSVIGSVSYELVAADMAATGAGYESLAALVEANDPSVAGSVMLAMSLGIIGGVVGCLFLGKGIQTGMASFREKSGAWGALVMSCFVMALMAVFAPARSLFMGTVATLTLLTSALITVAHRWIIKKYKVKWLNNFIMADALILGMASAVFWNYLLG